MPFTFHDKIFRKTSRDEKSAKTRHRNAKKAYYRHVQTKRVIVIVLDGLGVGELPDAAKYADTGSNTLGNLLHRLSSLHLPNLAKLGLLELLPTSHTVANPSVIGCYGKMRERSCGKDSTVGHWELMGVMTHEPFPTFPRGFPASLIRAFEKKIHRKVLANKVASGTEIIKELGQEHLATGSPIVYTSVDSVFQIAAHESAIPLAELYRICGIARGLLKGRHAVGRVIARPFKGEPGNFVRTPDRRDFTLAPPAKTVLDRIKERGGRTLGIGKIGDLFSDRGLSRVLHTKSNKHGIAETLKAIRKDPKAKFIFTNLVDTDMLYGHRNDCEGYYHCLEEFDAALPSLMLALKKTDMLCITSDHGCDPTTPGTDHTREYVPLLIYGARLRRGVNLGSRLSFADLGQTILELLGYPKIPEGKSFAKELTG